MFDRFLSHLSLRRSTAGIYYELRTLRQMLEIIFEHEGLELPQERRSRVRHESVEDLSVAGLSEEQLAAKAAHEIKLKRFKGEDPGTAWQEDPNR